MVLGTSRRVAITEDVTLDPELVIPTGYVMCKACRGTGNPCEGCGGDCYDGPNILCQHANVDGPECEECSGWGYIDTPQAAGEAELQMMYGATSNGDGRSDFVKVEGGGQKQTHVNGEAKPMWDLFDPHFHLDIVKVLTQPIATGKYEPENWKKVGKVHYLRSMESHVQAMKRGEVLDPESGLPHSAHAACNMMFHHYFDHNEEVK